ncbi:hypothetical protein [Wohlfahrtiimonas larvae]|uniref:Uncharacterized protein n=1 Tax=Wohlfahrtiimonas larvae TaxID=1157986 RepID=A0ABP9MB23_9GAMM|nr:hypothetical protein [Wohlfahrtiimonas larvae]
MTKIITLIGADARFSASIAQLLKLKTKGQFVLGDSGDIKLVDADSIEGRQAIDRHLDARTIILTVSPEQFEHSLIIRKPIKIEELLEVLEEMSGKTKAPVKAKDMDETQQTNVVTGNPFAKFMDPNYLAKHKQQKNAVPVSNQENAQAIEEVVNTINEDQLLGTQTAFSYWREELEKKHKVLPYVPDDAYFEQLEKTQLIEMSSIYAQTDDIYYDMSDYASLQIFKNIFQHKFDNQLHYFKFKEAIVFIFGDGIVLSSLPTNNILLFSEIKSSNIDVIELTSKDKFMTLLKEFTDYHYVDALNGFSRSVLIAAKGRIINGKDIKEPLGLMRKKDVAKDMIQMPYMKELDSVWGFRNVSLRDTVELLPEVNPFYIFSYYTLCDLYGFFDNELVDNKSKKQLDLNALLSELQKL